MSKNCCVAFYFIQISVSCIAGTYRNSSMSACTRCDTNSVSTTEATKCTVCEAGTVANEDNTECGESKFIIPFSFIILVTLLEYNNDHIIYNMSYNQQVCLENPNARAVSRGEIQRF